jgi:peptidyl-tRNA hydrolase
MKNYYEEHRGRILTTLPRILQLDLQKLQQNCRQEGFRASDFDNGTQLLQLQQKAQNRGLWRAAISELTQQQHKTGSNATDISPKNDKQPPDVIDLEAEQTQ